MALRGVKNLLYRSQIVKRNGLMILSLVWYFDTTAQRNHTRSLCLLNGTKSLLKANEVISLIEESGLINGRAINVIDKSRVHDDILLEKIHLFKSLARDFIGCPSVQEKKKKNMIVALGKYAECKLPLCFSKAGERESITVDSLIKVADILNVSAQQTKVVIVRATICPQVTRHQILTGALEDVLDGLKSEVEYFDSRFPSKQVKMAKQIVVSGLKVLDIAT